MTPCCDSLKTEGFISKGNGKYYCHACRRDISRLVLDMFFADPWGTIKLKVAHHKKEVSK